MADGREPRLSVVRGRRGGTGLVERIGHAGAFDRLLRDSVNHVGCCDPGGLQQCRYDIDHMMELPVNAPLSLMRAGHDTRHALPRATEERRDPFTAEGEAVLPAVDS
jgi:hypothetical protein